MAIEAIMASIVVIVLGGGLVTWLAVLTRRAVRHQRELAAKRGTINSQQELESYIREIDQAISDEEVTRLDKKGRGEG